jgi:hypothetical protein
MLWGSNAASSANSPTHSSALVRANTTNQTAAFQNTSPSLMFGNNAVFGVYGVTNTMVKAAESNATHKTLNLTPGWYSVLQGMGPVANIVINTAGSLYSNNDKLIVTSASGVNTTANVSTNATGGVVGFGPFSVSGGKFVNVGSLTVAITNTTGGTANGTLFTGTAVLGGRAGRIQRECLVSLGSMTPASATNPNTALFPSS